MTNPLAGGDDHVRRQPQEQPVFGDDGTFAHSGRQLGWLGDRAKVAIQDQIALVGLEGSPIGILA